MKIKLFALILFLTVFAQCKNNKEDYSSYRTKMLININKIIENEYALLEIKMDKLYQEIELYNNTGDVFHLSNSRIYWLELIEQWNKIRTFNVLDVRYNLLHTFIYSKPNASKIEQNILDKTNISVTELSALGADQKGINTIEYLLFKNQNLEVTDSSFNFEVNFESRMNMLIISAEEAKVNITSLKNNWKNNYSPNFLSNNELGISQPFNEVFNQTIEVITVNLKDLNQHLADNNFKTFGFYSQTELIQLEESIKGIQLIYNANGKESFNSYLELEVGNDELSQKVNSAFKDLLEDEVFDFDSFQSLNIVQKERLKTKLRNLSALLSIDVSSKLMIQVTLSDTDGD